MGQYKSCIECINLALKYTPAESTGIFSRLLSQRSEVEQQLGEYTRGLEDARKASMIAVDMLEVSKANFNYPFCRNCKRASIRLERAPHLNRMKRVQLGWENEEDVIVYVSARDWDWISIVNSSWLRVNGLNISILHSESPDLGPLSPSWWLAG